MEGEEGVKEALWLLKKLWPIGGTHRHHPHFLWQEWVTWSHLGITSWSQLYTLECRAQNLGGRLAVSTTRFLLELLHGRTGASFPTTAPPFTFLDEPYLVLVGGGVSKLSSWMRGKTNKSNWQVVLCKRKHLSCKPRSHLWGVLLFPPQRWSISYCFLFL